jgi:hypothetical protein
MWSMVILTICVLSLSLTSAFPALPLGEAVVEKFNENGRTKFIVEVQEMGKPQPEKQPAREFPWPYVSFYCVSWGVFILILFSHLFSNRFCPPSQNNDSINSMSIPH